MNKTEEEAAYQNEQKMLIDADIRVSEEEASYYEGLRDGIIESASKSFIAGVEWQKKRAIEAFKENCQRPKDTEPCECKLCVRWVGGHCELMDGFIEKLNS